MLAAEYEGFAHFVIGKVKRIGRENVLKQYSTLNGPTEFYWLKKAYERLLDHAEQINIKKTPPEGEASQTTVNFYFELAKRAGLIGEGENACVRRNNQGSVQSGQN